MFTGCSLYWRYKRHKAGAHCSIVGYFRWFSVQPYQFFSELAESILQMHTRTHHIYLYHYIFISLHRSATNGQIIISSWLVSLSPFCHRGCKWLYWYLVDGMPQAAAWRVKGRWWKQSCRPEKGFLGLPWVDLIGFRMLLLLLFVFGSKRLDS